MFETSRYLWRLAAAYRELGMRPAGIKRALPFITDMERSFIAANVAPREAAAIVLLCIPSLIRPSHADTLLWHWARAGMIDFSKCQIAATIILADVMPA